VDFRVEFDLMREWVWKLKSEEEEEEDETVKRKEIGFF
jgi:hypothetical protein